MIALTFFCTSKSFRSRRFPRSEVLGTYVSLDTCIYMMSTSRFKNTPSAGPNNTGTGRSLIRGGHQSVIVDMKHCSRGMLYLRKTKKSLRPWNYRSRKLRELCEHCHIWQKNPTVREPTSTYYIRMIRHDSHKRLLVDNKSLSDCTAHHVLPDDQKTRQIIMVVTIDNY